MECFCSEPCKIYKDKKDEDWAKCGLELDKTKLWDDLRGFKTKKQKKAYLRTYSTLGCKLNIPVAKYEYLEDYLFGIPPKFHLKCDEHGLICKVGITKSEGPNLNRTFFTCEANLPDPQCSFFKWCDDPTVQANMKAAYQAHLRGDDIDKEDEKPSRAKGTKRSTWKTTQMADKYIEEHNVTLETMAKRQATGNYVTMTSPLTTTSTPITMGTPVVGGYGYVPPTAGGPIIPPIAGGPINASMFDNPAARRVNTVAYGGSVPTPGNTGGLF